MRKNWYKTLKIQRDGSDAFLTNAPFESARDHITASTVRQTGYFFKKQHAKYNTKKRARKQGSFWYS